MRLHRRLWVFMVLVLALMWMIPRSVSAQFTPTEIRIGFTDAFAASDKPNELLTRIYFTLVDPGGKPVVDPKIHFAHVVMSDPRDGGPYKAEVRQTDGPIFITLVFDTSGSMIGLEQTMREAAIKLVESGIPNAQFSIFAFGDQPSFLSDFTNDQTRLRDAINQVQPTSLTGRCLFDAAVEALVYTAQRVLPSDRRGVVIITGGVDQKQIVVGKVERCSHHTLEEVRLIATNRRYPIPIHLVGFGFKGGIDESSLRNLSLATKGTVTIGTDFETLFGDILNALNAQKVVEVRIKTLKTQLGNGSLMIELEDGTILPRADFEVSIPRDYHSRGSP